MEMTTPKAGKPASDSALLRGSGRWSVLWALGMFAIFLGERMIGAGSSRTVGDGHRPGAGDRRDGRALHARREGGGRPAQAREHAAGAVRGRPGGRVAVRDPVGSLGLRVQAAAGAQLAEAVDRAVGAVAGRRGSRPRGRSCSSSWRTREMARAPRLELGRIRSADAVRLRPGRRADRGVLVRVRRVGARQEARPRLLPHLAPGRGDAPDRAAAWISRSRSPCSSRRRTRCATRSTTTSPTWPRNPASSRSPTTTSTSTR